MWYMKKKEVSHEDLQVLKKFLKEKKITYTALSKEMHYSTSHVIRVFNGEYSVQPKFMKSLLHSIQQILQKDVKQFYDLIRGNDWCSFT